MEQEGLRVRLPKLASDGSNWVVYRDRVIWALQTSTIADHITANTPSTAYINLGDIDSVTAAEAGIH